MRHFELRAGHVEHHLQCPTIWVAMQESLKVIWRNQALKSG